MQAVTSLRPRVRVKRACAVGMARRGAQKGRLEAPCKAGGHCWPLTDRCRCRRAPQIRAMGDPIGRAAPPHERSQPRTAHEPRRSDAMWSERMVPFQLETRARGRPTFQDTPSEPLDANRRNPCRNGSNTPRSADRRLRDGPRRRHEYPWTMPGGSWSMENRGLAQGGACPFPSSQGRVGQAGLLFRGEWVQPDFCCLPPQEHVQLETKEFCRLLWASGPRPHTYPPEPSSATLSFRNAALP